LANYLVTGGAGFIGSHIVTALVDRGQHVRVIDNFETGNRENLSDVSRSIEIIDGSITDQGAIRGAMAGVDYCLHQAALGSVPRSISDPLRSNEANVVGSLSVYLAARDAGVKRVIVASSSSTYGPNAPIPTPETAPLAPASPYAVSKAAADLYGGVCAQIYGLDIVRLRYFNVFGPRQNPRSQYSAVIPKLIMALIEGKSPEIHGDGSQSRDFTFVENVVNANLAACEAPGPIAGAYNVACGDSTSVMELFRYISGILHVDIPPTFTPPRAGDVPRSRADCSRAREAFGYEPRVRIREGLERTVAWYRKQPM
jgi:nucleoside-diphosphate-sugar epimerase